MTKSIHDEMQAAQAAAEERNEAAEFTLFQDRNPLLDTQEGDAEDADNTAPIIRLSDIHLMIGSLVDTNGWPTFKGRVIGQIAKDSLFAGWLTYQSSLGETNSPSDQGAALRALEDSVSPYKGGMDSTLSGLPDENPLRGLKARADLIFDCLKSDTFMDDEKVTQIARMVKDRATNEQIASIGKKNPNHKNVMRAVSVGLNTLDYADKSFDGLFLNKAVTFVNNYPSKFPSAEDTSNAALLMGVLEPRVKAGATVAPVTLDF